VVPNSVTRRVLIPTEQAIDSPIQLYTLSTRLGTLLRRIYRGAFTEFNREAMSVLGSLPLWGNSEFYVRVRSLPGVNPKPPFSLILDSTTHQTLSQSCFVGQTTRATPWFPTWSHDAFQLERDRPWIPYPTIPSSDPPLGLYTILPLPILHVEWQNRGGRGRARNIDYKTQRGISAQSPNKQTNIL